MLKVTARFSIAIMIVGGAGCAGGGSTVTGNATGGTVSSSVTVGDICAGVTANCTPAEKKAAEAATIPETAK